VRIRLCSVILLRWADSRIKGKWMSRLHPSKALMAGRLAQSTHGQRVRAVVDVFDAMKREETVAQIYMTMTCIWRSDSMLEAAASSLISTLSTLSTRQAFVNWLFFSSVFYVYLFFFTRNHTNARYWYSKSVCLRPSVRPSRSGLRWKRLNILS